MSLPNEVHSTIVGKRRDRSRTKVVAAKVIKKAKPVWLPVFIHRHIFTV